MGLTSDASWLGSCHLHVCNHAYIYVHIRENGMENLYGGSHEGPSETLKIQQATKRPTFFSTEGIDTQQLKLEIRTYQKLILKKSDIRTYTKFRNVPHNMRAIDLMTHQICREQIADRNMY